MFSFETSGQILTELDTKDLFEVSNDDNQFVIQKILAYDNTLYKVIKSNCKYNETNYSLKCYYDISSKQKKLKLNKIDDYPLAFTNEHAYYCEADFDNDKLIVKIREINSSSTESVTAKNTLELGFYNEIHIAKTGDLIISHGSEGSGIDGITRYSKKLSKIYSFSAVDNINDDYDVTYDENKNFTYYIIKSRKESCFKIRLYESANDKNLITSKQFDLDDGYYIGGTVIDSDKIIVLINNNLGERSLLTLDTSLNIVNYFDLPMGVWVSRGKMISSEGKVFFSSGLSIFAYDTTKNKIVWENIKNTNTPKGYTTKGNITTFRGSKVFNLDLNHIISIEGTYIDGPEVENKVINCMMTVLNSDNGDVKQKINLGDFIGEIKVVNNSKNIVIYGNKKIKIFQKI